MMLLKTPKHALLFQRPQPFQMTPSALEYFQGLPLPLRKSANHSLNKMLGVFPACAQIPL